MHVIHGTIPLDGHIPRHKAPLLPDGMPLDPYVVLH
jgi:hypothetical protein